MTIEFKIGRGEAIVWTYCPLLVAATIALLRNQPWWVAAASFGTGILIGLLGMTKRGRYVRSLLWPEPPVAAPAPVDRPCDMVDCIESRLVYESGAVDTIARFYGPDRDAHSGVFSRAMAAQREAQPQKDMN